VVSAEVSAVVTVRELLDTHVPGVSLALVAGARGLDRPIALPRLQQPGLALAGFLAQLHPDRVQVLGNSEISYLASLPEPQARAAAAAVAGAGVACFVVTNGSAVPDVLAQPADAAGVPVLSTAARTGDFIRAATAWLEERLAPEITLHAGLVEVHGLGILIFGDSGIGKSEAALDLVSRGHRLVADDIVLVRRISPTVLRGRAAELLAHHMEIRGLGVIDIEALYGTLATLEDRPIDMAVELTEAGDEAADRLGLDDATYTLLEVCLPLVRIPVTAGRTLGLLIETAARNQLLRWRGRHSAADFAARIDRAAAGRSRSR
jgi:HPr kinase/phosphorylase